MNKTLNKKFNTDLKYVYSDNDTLSIIFQNNEVLLGVVGEFNNNIKELENITKTNIYSRGNSILVKSTPQNNELVKNAIKFLADQFIINGTIEKKDIISSVNKFMINEKNNSKEKNIEYIIKTPKKSVIPRSEKQKKYVRALKEKQIIISSGPAGTGKTFLAVAVGLTMLLEKKIERIILSRPAVEAGERLGFLPGDLKEKIDPYLRPLYDALNDLMSKKILESNIDSGIIEIAPLAFMRGRTLENAFIILDEAQNTTNMQMKMFVTRLGRNSKMVILGDVTQIDLPTGSSSGLKEILKLIPKEEGIEIINFQSKDIVRHRLVDKIVKAYSKLKK